MLITALALMLAVSPADLATTICAVGWTHRQRPSARYVRRLKAQALPAGADPRAYVMDHVMPLGLGGAPGAENLRLQTLTDAKRKDIDEHRLHRAVCAGRISLPAARAEMQRVWP